MLLAVLVLTLSQVGAGTDISLATRVLRLPFDTCTTRSTDGDFVRRHVSGGQPVSSILVFTCQSAISSDIHVKDSRKLARQTLTHGVYLSEGALTKQEYSEQIVTRRKQMRARRSIHTFLPPVHAPSRILALHYALAETRREAAIMP